MKYFLLLILVLAVNADFIENTINKANKRATTWVTTTLEENQFKDWTESDIKKMLGFIPDNAISTSNHAISYKVPSHFDQREEWKHCNQQIYDQGGCGSCWSFAVNSAVDYRRCIHKGELLNLSEQQLVSCDSSNNGCRGGQLPSAFYYHAEDGVVKEEFYPYKSGDDGLDHTCEIKHITADHYYMDGDSIDTIYGNREAIQTEIMKNGPVATGFYVYEDFLAYKGGIYQRKSSHFMGGHAVVIIGWGLEDGIGYWICKNSWGASWGEHGYFRIAFGECQIENFVTFGLPK